MPLYTCSSVMAVAKITIKKDLMPNSLGERTERVTVSVWGNDDMFPSADYVFVGKVIELVTEGVNENL